MSISVEGALDSIRKYGFTTNSTKAIQEITAKEFSGSEYRDAIRDAISTEVIDPSNLDDVNAEYTYKYLVQELVRGENDIQKAIHTARVKASAMAEDVTQGKRQFVLASKQSNEEGETSDNKPKKVKKKDQAEQIYKANKDDLSRKEMINKFIDELGMSKAGASTYYHNCKKKFDQ